MYTFGGNVPVLTIVVPCYNEEEVLQETASRLLQIMHELISSAIVSEQSKILFVDDGSKDRTWSLIEATGRATERVKGLKLARNVGHQNALLAGLTVAANQSDCVISIDADLQDDVNVIKDFVFKFLEGYEVVYGVRNERKTDTFFKRNTALAFYRLMEWMGVSIVYNHADYRLLSHRVLQCLLNFKETNLFLRGVIPLIGFKSVKVYYDRHERFAGESKYPLKKMLAFAWEGITSFSTVPIRFLTYIGMAFVLLSFAAAIYILSSKMFGNTVSGWTSIMLSIWFIGGVQLTGLGLIGEYIGKVYKETKARPKFFIEVDNYSNSSETGKAPEPVHANSFN